MGIPKAEISNVLAQVEYKNDEAFEDCPGTFILQQSGSKAKFAILNGAVDLKGEKESGLCYKGFILYPMNLAGQECGKLEVFKV